MAEKKLAGLTIAGQKDDVDHEEAVLSSIDTIQVFDNVMKLRLLGVGLKSIGLITKAVGKGADWKQIFDILLKFGLPILLEWLQKFLDGKMKVAELDAKLKLSPSVNGDCDEEDDEDEDEDDGGD